MYFIGQNASSQKYYLSYRGGKGGPLILDLPDKDRYAEDMVIVRGNWEFPAGELIRIYRVPRPGGNPGNLTLFYLSLLFNICNSLAEA